MLVQTSVHNLVQKTTLTMVLTSQWAPSRVPGPVTHGFLDVEKGSWRASIAGAYSASTAVEPLLT